MTVFSTFLNASKLIPLYIKAHPWSALFFGYIVFSVLLKSVSTHDLTVSCPIYYFMGIKCYGCGLTTSTIHLLHFDIAKAYEANALIFIVLPVLFFLFGRHWIQFVNEKKMDQKVENQSL